MFNTIEKHSSLKKKKYFEIVYIIYLWLHNAMLPKWIKQYKCPNYKRL